MFIAIWPGAISPSVIEGGCKEMFVDVICPKSCEFGDVHDSWSSESIFEQTDDQRWRGYGVGTMVDDGGETG